MANIKFADYLRSLSTRPVDGDDIFPLAPSTGPTLAKTLREYYRETLLTALLTGTATSPTSISPTISDIAGYATGVLAEVPLDAGFLVDAVTGQITCAPEVFLVRVTMYLIASGITSKDEELSLYLRGNTIGDIKIKTVGISNKQTEISDSVLFARALPANEIIRFGIAYSTTSPIVIEESTFEIDIIAQESVIL